MKACRTSRAGRVDCGRFREVVFISDKGRTRSCAVDGRRVDLVRPLSSSACIEGRSWGRDKRGVRVTSGCRGEFRGW
ncbi:MAG: DUF3011 domain-containing protein [Pseudoxanthomonas mexicana]|nr:DUF3011 domain-containing protein [Pseudoxanthomonas mexicana]